MATFNITYTAADGTRIASAFGRYWHLTDKATGTSRNATAAEVKAWLIRQLQDTVQRQERAEKEANLTVLPLDLT